MCPGKNKGKAHSQIYYSVEKKTEQGILLWD